MTRVLIFVISLLVFMACEKDDTNVQMRDGDPAIDLVCVDAAQSIPLIAGQNTQVGTVDLSFDGTGTLTVEYNLDEGWCLNETHLHVTDSFEGFPVNNTGNPKIGHFDYTSEHEGEGSFSYDVDLTSLGITEGVFYVAAHAEVCECEEVPAINDITEVDLPSTATINVAHPGDGAYFDLSVTDAGDLDGLYFGNCVDVSRGITPGQDYEALVYNSYDPYLPDNLVDNPENLDLINYIINQGYVDQVSINTGGTYCAGDVQMAIWTLIDDEITTAGIDCHDPDRVAEIVADAVENGEGFVPGCGDLLAVLFAPVDGTSQVIIGQVIIGGAEIPCPDVDIDFNGDCETAWMEGLPFIEQGSWAMYVAIEL